MSVHAIIYFVVKENVTHIDAVGKWLLTYITVHSHNGFFWVKRILSDQETDDFGFFFNMKWMTMRMRR